MKNHRIYSDLHQEFKEKNFFKISEYKNEKEQNLILAGDIYPISSFKKLEKKAFFEDFFLDLSSRFNKVFIVLGNHDFYKSTLSKQNIIDFQNYLSKFKNIFILSKHTPSIEDDNIVYIGATLWTNFGGKDYSIIPHNKYDTESNDFKYIKYISEFGYTKFKPKFWIKEFYEDFNWIKKQVELYKNRKIIITTHHSPTIETVDNDDKEGHFSIYYKSNLDDFIVNNPNIEYWLHGHIHTANNFVIGKTKILSNPIGYDELIDSNPEYSFF